MGAKSALASLETSILAGLRDVYDTAWGNAGETEYNDPFARLYLLRAGTALVAHHGRTFTLKPGQLAVIPANTPSWYECPKRMDLAWVHFTMRIFGGACPFDVLGWGYAVALEAPRRVGAQMDRLVRLAGSGDAVAALEADGLLRQLLSHFASTQRGGPRVEPRELGRFRAVFDHVEANLCRRIRLAELAGLVYLQPTYFSNLFSKLVGCPPMRYVMRRRIAAAQEMLWRRELSLRRIAAELGFVDEFHFSKAFKRELGVSPSVYRTRERV